ncbi:MAG: hypothetical protein K6F34_00665 [Lachnospiraceae bacterium]|nr:hypothetical protein [Lachnospiraceae bacterium]
MKKAGFERKILILMISTALILPSTIRVGAEEIILEPQVTAGCISAGVASLFMNDEDILPDDPDIQIEGEIIAGSEESLMLEKVYTDEVISSDGCQIEDEDICLTNRPDNIYDVDKLAGAVAGSVTLTDEEKDLADVTGDGDIAMDDVLKTARFVTGSISTL